MYRVSFYMIYSMVKVRKEGPRCHNTQQCIIRLVRNDKTEYHEKLTSGKKKDDPGRTLSW